MIHDARSTDSPLGPALDFLQKLWYLNHALELLSSRMEKTLGVTAQQRLIVRCVGKYPGMTASQLASLLHLDPGTISAALKRIADKRLLARRRDLSDSRRVALRLTAKGERLAELASGTVEQAVERLLASAGPGEVRATKKLLEQLAALLDEAAREKKPARRRPRRAQRRGVHRTRRR